MQFFVNNDVCFRTPVRCHHSLSTWLRDVTVARCSRILLGLCARLLSLFWATLSMSYEELLKEDLNIEDYKPFDDIYLWSYKYVYWCLLPWNSEAMDYWNHPFKDSPTDASFGFQKKLEIYIYLMVNNFCCYINDDGRDLFITHNVFNKKL